MRDLVEVVTTLWNTPGNVAILTGLASWTQSISKPRTAGRSGQAQAPAREDEQQVLGLPECSSPRCLWYRPRRGRRAFHLFLIKNSSEQERFPEAVLKSELEQVEQCHLA